MDERFGTSEMVRWTDNIWQGVPLNMLKIGYVIILLHKLCVWIGLGHHPAKKHGNRQATENGYLDHRSIWYAEWKWVCSKAHPNHPETQNIVFSFNIK